MEFLRVVEEELRGLAAEARRRHPVVQEAAERAILKLRNMREEYAVALRQQHEGNAPPLSMFRSQDLLRPFLLACNHADASPHLMNMAMGSIQYLINRDAILPSDAPNILRVLAIQSQSKDADVQKRVLQTMVMVVTWKSCDMTEDTVAQALGVCLGLHDAKNATVRTAADMTVRQIISLLFDRVADELGVTAAAAAAANNASGSGAAANAAQAAAGGFTVAGDRGMELRGEDNEAGTAEEAVVEEEDEGDGGGAGEGALRCAHLVFQDLCVLSRGEQGQWIKRTSVSATLGLELVEQVLSQQPILFRRFKVLRRLLSQEVCPLILQILRRRMDFPLLVRLLRAASTLTVTYGDLLPNEAHAILSTMLGSLGTGLGSEVDHPGGGRDGGGGAIGFSPVDDDGAGGCVSWAAVLTLEAIHRVLASPSVVLELFRHGGKEDSGSNGDSGTATVVEEMLHAVSQHLVRNLSNQSDMQGLEGMALAIRLGRIGSPSSSASPGEGKRLPPPPSLTNALAKDKGSQNNALSPPSSSRGGAAPTPRPSGANNSNSRGAGGGGSGTRSSSLELLHETEQPPLDDAELLLWALQCVVDLAASVGSLVDDEFGTSDTGLVVPSSVGLVPGESPPDRSRRHTLKRMCEVLWGPVLSSLSHVMMHCSDPIVVSTAVDGYKAFAVAAGILGVENALDGFVGSLCRFSLPQWHGTDVVVGGGASSGAAGGGVHGGGSPALGWNHVGTLEGVLQVVHRLGNLLRGCWHVVLDTLEQAAGLLGRRAIARPRWSPQSPETELLEVERHCNEVLLAAERLVEFSTCLEDEALYGLMSSLQALAVVDLANTSTVLPQERSIAREREAAQSQANGAGGEGRGAGAAAVAAASGLVSFVGAAARGVGAAMSEGREVLNRDRDNRNSNNSNSNSNSSSNVNMSAKAAKGGPGEARAHIPWVSSRLVVECAVANTWRLSVVWELVSGHLRVVAKAREPGKRGYAVRALRELIVDGVRRLHPLPAASSPAPPDSSNDNTASPEAIGTGTGPTPQANASSPPPGSSRSSAANAPTASTSGGDGGTTAAPPTPRGGNGPPSGQEEGFLPNFLGLRARLEGFGEEEAPFRWVFDSDVGGVFFAVRGRAARRTTVGGGEAFEGVLFRTMGLFALTPHVDTREATLQSLYTILQSCGQVLDSAWPVILNLLLSVAKGATSAAPPPPSPQTPAAVAAGAESKGGHTDNDAAAGGYDDEEDSGAAEMRPVVWGGACLSLAFKCLQLVVDDFLERLPREQVPRLVTCAGAFGAQTESVNLSLTAIGMLWTVCDTFADATASGNPAPAAPGGSKDVLPPSENIVPTGGGKDVLLPPALSGPSSSSSGHKSSSSSAHKARPSLRSLWPTMLFQLRSLSVDFRPELRNCAVNTLFSAAVGNGDGLSESDWKQFLQEVTFPLIEQVLESTNSASRGANTAVAPELKKGVRMLMHHTRDTDQKQWNETRVLAMQGLGRVLRAYVTVLSSWDWFSGEGGVWTKSLEVYRDACLVGSDSQEVSLSGVDGITTMVLLVGRMGLKSVQVRAGAGMKIVDGTLQRSSQQPARAGGGRRGNSNNNNNNNPAAERGGGEGAETETTPQFSAARPALYAMAWAAMLEASGFEADSGGDVAAAFVQGLAAVYKAGVEEGAELCPGQEGEEERMRQLFETLDGLFAPRVAPASASGGGAPQATDPRRAVYMPKVTPGQRAILEFLQDDLRTGWRLAVRLLAKYSVVVDGSEEASSAAAATAAAAAGPGGVSVECVREAAAALSSVMSNGRVPKRDSAVALEGLLFDVSAPCVRRLEGLRKHKSGPDSAAAAAGAPPTRPSAAAMPGAAVASATDDAPVSSWPSLDGYSEVMQLVLALLTDGLPSVADPASFQQDQRDQERDKRLVSCLKVAIKGIGAVAECRRLKMAFLKKGLSLGSPQAAGSETTPSGGGGGANGGARGFPLLLREALVLVTRAVRSELVPLVHKGSEDARDAARALIDTLGAIALVSTVDTPQPPPPTPSREAAHSSSGGSSANSSGDSSVAAADNDCAVENSASSDAFGLAVHELAAMCSEGASAGGWAQLGLPLRRRACWHLLRCVWSTTYRFRKLEDEVDAADAPARTPPEDMARLRYSLALRADRCTCVLATVGKVRLPPALLTPRFKKLVATKQGQENLPLLDTQARATATASPALTGAGGVEGDGEQAGPEDAVWASMAEEGEENAAVDTSSSSGVDATSRSEAVEGGDKVEGGSAGGGGGGGRGEGRGGREHLILLCRALLTCSASRTERVRSSTALLLADADIPGALDALQDEVTSLRRALRQREAQLTRKDSQMGDLRAQVAAGAFM